MPGLTCANNVFPKSFIVALFHLVIKPFLLTNLGQTLQIQFGGVKYM